MAFACASCIIVEGFPWRGSWITTSDCSDNHSGRRPTSSSALQFKQAVPSDLDGASTSTRAAVRHESTMSHKSFETAPDRLPTVVPVPMDSDDGDLIEQFQPESEFEAFATPPAPAAAAQVDLTPARDEEGRAAPPSAESVDLHRPDQSDVALERSHSAAWPLVLGVVVVIGLVGWYLIAGPVYWTAVSPTLTGKSSPVASSSAPAPPGLETPEGLELPEGPEPRAPWTQPVLPPAAAPDVTPELRETLKDPATAAVSAPGRLLVRSTPSGARVFVDDHEYGVTPALVRDLAVRIHRIRVILAGYISEERPVPITSATPAQSITIELRRPQATSAQELTPTSTPRGGSGGAMSVDSHPAGANVYIDGRLVGKTPVSLSRIGAGSHEVRLELEAHHGWSSLVRVVPGGLNRVTASLEEDDQPNAEKHHDD